MCASSVMRAPSKKITRLRAIVQRGVPVVGVVEPRKVFGDTDGVDAGGDVFEDAGIPDALLALAVRAVVIEVGELADERALPDTRSADNGYSHTAILLRLFRVVRVIRGLLASHMRRHGQPLPLRRAQTSV